MKILQIYKDFYPPVVGGIEKHINILSKGLLNRGIDVNVLVSNTKAKLSSEIIDDVKVFKAPQLGRFASAPINVTFPMLLRRVAREADILHFHLPNPTATASYLISGIKKPVVVTYHSDIIRQAKMKILYWPIEKVFLDRTAAIIATSPNYIRTSNVLCKYNRKCRMIPLGIEINRFRMRDFQLEDQIKRKYKEPIILFIGKFRYYKGLKVLIEAIKELDAQLLLVGDGRLSDCGITGCEIENLSSKLTVLGELSDNEVNAYLNACDLLVLPSIFRSEAFGIVLLEAMACGKPIVCTELGTGTSFINRHNETGYVIPPNDPAKLVNAIDMLISDPDTRKKFGQNGKKRVEYCFDSELMIDNIIELYKKVLDKSARAIPSSFHLQGADPSHVKLKVLRVISRLNIGGPSIHASLLLKRIDTKRFESKLITGTISSHEGDMNYLLKDTKGLVRNVPELQREVHPLKDFIALLRVLMIILNERPHIIHTHTAKAGAIARFAALIYNLLHKKKIKIVHTYHGNVLEGYFSKSQSQFYRIIEKALGIFTDRIIAISNSQRWELISKYRIAPPEKVATINLGLDLAPFLSCWRYKGTLRKAIGIDSRAVLVGIVGRLAPVKNHLMFLKAAKYFCQKNSHIPIKFLVVGDGELKTNLMRLAEKLNISDKVFFYGWEKDIKKIYADIDILALTSINEGTPVSIIEAMASGVPVITTGVGGVKDLLGNFEHDMKSPSRFIICERGILIPKYDYIGMANGIAHIIQKGLREKIENARSYVLHNYSDERLVQNIEKLYFNLLGLNYSRPTYFANTDQP